MTTPLELEFELWNLMPDALLDLSLHIADGHGTVVFNTASLTDPAWHGRRFPCGRYRSVCTVPGELLNHGLYRVHLLVVHEEAHVVFRLNDAVVFEVLDAPELRGAWYGAWPGVVHPHLAWRTERLDGPAQDGNAP